MRILIAPDKFKGTISAKEVCLAIQSGLINHSDILTPVLFPLADGGDGTVDVLLHHLNGTIRSVSSVDPFNRPIIATYGISHNKEVAFIELSSASGLKLLHPDEYNVSLSTTRGTGILIQDAIQNGVKKIILAIGGSATNDAGVGAASVLGYGFYDEEGNPVEALSKNIGRIVHIDKTQVNPGVFETEFSAICDVTNPFYGESGAAFIYGPQKGASRTEVEFLDRGLKDFAEVIMKELGCSIDFLEGAGAGGGFGGGAVAFFGASLKRGIEIVFGATNFESKVKESDVIITGEGKLDNQTLQGKVVSGVCQLAAKFDKPVLCITGIRELSEEALIRMGIRKVFSLTDQDTLENSIRDPFHSIRRVAQHQVYNWLKDNKH